MIRRIGLLSVLAGFAVAANASPAGATVTIGSNLGRAPDVSSQNDPRPTFANFRLAPDRQAPGGLASPVNGTVVRWRIRAAGLTEVTNFRIIHHTGITQFSGAGTSPQVTPPANATTTYDVQLPIGVGDAIGLDCCDPGPAEFFVSDLSGFSVLSEWTPALGTPTSSSPYAIALNADIEPTNAFRVDGIVHNWKKGRATLTVVAPNAGQVIASGRGVLRTAALVTVPPPEVTPESPNPAQLPIKATGKKKRKLNETGKVKLKLAVTYTPTGGSPNTQSVKVTLKKKV